MQRTFLGNDQPLLHLTANYLIKRYHQKGQLNLQNMILVLQEQQAISRLEEILAEKAETLDPAWYPPEFLTIGALPERLYELKKPLADDLTQCFAWLAAIDRLDSDNPDLLYRLIPSPPRQDDLEARAALGRMFAKLHRELAADTLDFIHVAELCRKLNIESESNRWHALAKLQEKYHATLDSLGIWDAQSARLFALEHPEEFEIKHAQFQNAGTEILLVGVADMNLAQKEMLRHFQDIITPLVFAPESWANRFDDFGCLIPHVWQDVRIEISDEQIHIVESANEQAEQVLRCLTRLQGKYAPPEIIIGVPDKQVIPFIERQLEQADVKTRLVAGKSIRQTSVYRFLETLLAYIETPSFAHYATLVRHPDVETSTLISELDRYHTDRLPVDWQVENTPFCELLDTQDLAVILDKIISEQNKDDAYQKILEALSQIEEIPAKLLPDLSLADTIRLVLTQVGSTAIPIPHEPKAIELVGWLHLAMDDAEIIIVSGMNDGIVPAFQSSDMFLPDTMRRNLALEDNSRRYARDAYALSCLLATRQDDPKRVQLIGSRRSVEGDPMLPSRLFFADEDEIVAKRVKRFFAERREVLPKIQFPAESRSTVVFAPPQIPKNAGRAIREMSVTDFAKYKRCPYRFYLECCVKPKLRTLHDADTELPAGAFGSMIHDVLELFGKTGGIKTSTSAGQIRDFLVRAIRELVRQRYGEPSRPVIAIQAERAIKRLEAFADWQASWAAEYEILATELQFEGERFSLDVKDDAMRLRGRIDRIDRHKKTGELIVWDYKTGKILDPRQHIKGNDWVDFQLPLYYHLLGQHREYAGDLRRGFRLGYIVLPSDVTKTGSALANWDGVMLHTALDEARRIVASIWNNEFDMTTPPPRNCEAFAAICGDF
ncbi:MAG: PD-(D/E)XK nuclease family protein [Planctomycetaceae bacterium]|nr:PD-(D/E)XK nuclease family protein [Planctomycetaceae bacterium]